MAAEVVYITEIVTVYETTDVPLTTDLTSLKPSTTPNDDNDAIFTPQIILGIAVAATVAVILLLAIVIAVMACRNKKKAQPSRAKDSEMPVNLMNIDNSKFDSAPRSEEHAWAYSNNAVDIMGDEGIEVDLDQHSEDKMKHLADTFGKSSSPLGAYKPGKTRANFDRQSFYAEHQQPNDSNDHTYGNLNVGNPYEEGRPSSFLFFRGDLPATPL